MRDTHALFSSVLAVAFAATAVAQTSSKPAAPAEELPDAPAATAAAMTSFAMILTGMDFRKEFFAAFHHIAYP